MTDRTALSVPKRSRRLGVRLVAVWAVASGCSWSQTGLGHLQACPGVKGTTWATATKWQTVDELPFRTKLPRGFAICVAEYGIDYTTLEVRDQRTGYLSVFVGPFPYGGPGAQHMPPGADDEHVARSKDGLTEDAFVRSGGRNILLRRLLRTSQRDQLGNPIYVVVEVQPGMEPSGAQNLLSSFAAD